MNRANTLFPMDDTDVRAAPEWMAEAWAKQKLDYCNGHWEDREMQERFLLENHSNELGGAKPKAFPAPQWMRRLKYEVEAKKHVFTHETEHEDPVPDEEMQHIHYQDVGRYASGVGHRSPGKFPENSMYNHNGRPIKILLLSHKEAHWVERECYLQSVFSPIKVECFFLGSVSTEQKITPEAVMKLGMKDIVHHYIALSKHPPDTLFICFEADWRSTPHATKVSCFWPPNDIREVTEEERKILATTTSSTFNNEENRFEAPKLGTEGKELLDLFVALATAAHEFNCDDFIWVSWNNREQVLKTKPKSKRNSVPYNGTNVVLYNQQGSAKIMEKFEDPDSFLYRDTHYDISLRNEAEKADPDKATDLHACWAFPAVGGFADHPSGIDPEGKPFECNWDCVTLQAGASVRPGTDDVLRTLYKFTPKGQPESINSEASEILSIDPRDPRWHWKTRRPTPGFYSIQEIRSGQCTAFGSRKRISELDQDISRRAKTIGQSQIEQAIGKPFLTKRAKRVRRKTAQTQMRRNMTDDSQVIVLFPSHSTHAQPTQRQPLRRCPVCCFIATFVVFFSVSFLCP